MSALALSVALVALILAVMAFARTGGMKMLKHQVEDARRVSADALERLEDALRGEGAAAHPPRSREKEDPPRPGDVEG